MIIHILSSVHQASQLRHVLTRQIEASGNRIGNLEESSFVIGLLDDSDWEQVKEPKRKIILKEVNKVDTVPASAILVNILLLTLIDSPQTTLSEWLSRVPDPLTS